MHPIIYIYKKTSDKGRELKYSLRSLKNVTNWNGEVYICGDREEWFSDNVRTIEGFERSAYKYIDVLNKLEAIVSSKAPDDFIFFNDDFYITEPTEVRPLYDGELESIVSNNAWQTMKSDTYKYLTDNGCSVKNYSIHVPIIYNKQNLHEIINICRNHKKQMSYRSLYGNILNIGGEQYDDRKTQTNKLLTGELLSTRAFTPELETLFPEPSKFERN